MLSRIRAVILCSLSLQQRHDKTEENYRFLDSVKMLFLCNNSPNIGAADVGGIRKYGIGPCPFAMGRTSVTV